LHKKTKETSLTGLSDKYMRSADICHIIGRVHFYTRWPLVQLTANVVKCDTRHKSCLSHIPVMRTWLKRNFTSLGWV